MDSTPVKVYLAGLIQGSHIEECKAWRKKIREHYMHWKEGMEYPIVWLDPLNGEEKVSKDGLTSSVPPNAIIHRDYQCVIKSDIVLVNMETFGSDRPLTGTLFEIAWAWEHHKPIIMISSDRKYMEHPFLKNMVSNFVSSVDELLEQKIINFYFKGWNNAIY
jgi:nucleoside 2-deoxyribosyltransferase